MHANTLRIQSGFRLLLILILAFGMTGEVKADDSNPGTGYPAPTEEPAVIETSPYTGDEPVDINAYPDAAEGTIISVPGAVGDLQSAINQVPNEGIIELAGGTYPAPSGGFRITNTGKRFTIRAAYGASVTLDGGKGREILRFMNTSLSASGPVTFQNLTFANGYSNSAGIAGGVTLHHAEATFINCKFIANAAGASGVGGGSLVGLGSVAFFFDSTWQNNTAVNYGGGLVVGDQSKVYVHHSYFTGNRTNLPNHSPTAAGGAIHVGNSLLRVSNSRFENNQAGYVGGGIYAIGTWASPLSTPQADVIVSNSTFVNNSATRDGSVSLNVPTEGGAFHAEAQTTARIFHSRFINNTAMSGGAITLYQAIVQVEGSVFLGNAARGQGSLGGYGGAISGASNDTSSDGGTNRRSASLTVTDSYIQGRYGSTTTAGYGGGGIYLAGDFNRTYGANGVSKIGTASDNRASLVVDHVVFNDLDVVKGSDDGAGGAVLIDLTNATIQNSLIMNSDAQGANNGSGGGLAILDQSVANISGVTFAHNSAGKYGGAVFAQGSTLNLSGSDLIENSVPTQYGSAIFAAPLSAWYATTNVSGLVQGNRISNNTGQPIFDDDRTNGPINSVIYNNNDFFGPSADPVVYSDAIPNYGWKRVAELNALVVNRANGTSSDKSQSANRALTSIPAIGRIFAVPSAILGVTAANDPETVAPAYIAYAWSGNSASLNGSSLSGKTGVQAITSPGTFTLSVDGSQSSAQAANAPLPALAVTKATGGGSITFNWSLTSGTFLDIQMDQGARVNSAPSGSVQVPSSSGLAYHFYAITEEGGTVNTQVTGSVSLPKKVLLPALLR
jgi:predicted outer membrane repeat protein